MMDVNHMVRYSSPFLPPSSINVLLNQAFHFVYIYTLVDDKSSLKAHQENVHHGAFKPVIIT